MKITVIGGGRIGSALARRSDFLGHQTRTLVRSLSSQSTLPMPAGVTVQEVSCAEPEDEEIVVLAAPAWADPTKEDLVRAFLAKLDKSVFIASVVAYARGPMPEWVPGNPFLQFLCSPAVADQDHEPLIILRGHRPRVTNKFELWIGPARLEYANSSNYDRLISIFLGAAVHLETTHKILASLDPPATMSERQFAAATMLEGFKLMEMYGFDPRNALDACFTPRGITRQAIAGVFENSSTTSKDFDI